MVLSLQIDIAVDQEGTDDIWQSSDSLTQDLDNDMFYTCMNISNPGDAVIMDFNVSDGVQLKVNEYTACTGIM